MSEDLPDPSDGFACMRYADREAEAGHVGTVADRAVLKYLVQNTWRNTPTDSRQSVGEVMMGTARVGKMAAVIGLSRRGIQQSLGRLEQAGWIYRELMTWDSGQQAVSRIVVLLDLPSHRKREGMRTQCADGGALSARTGAN